MTFNTFITSSLSLLLLSNSIAFGMDPESDWEQQKKLMQISKQRTAKRSDGDFLTVDSKGNVLWGLKDSFPSSQINGSVTNFVLLPHEDLLFSQGWVKENNQPAFGLTVFYENFRLGTFSSDMPSPQNASQRVGFNFVEGFSAKILQNLSGKDSVKDFKFIGFAPSGWDVIPIDPQGIKSIQNEGESDNVMDQLRMYPRKVVINALMKDSLDPQFKLTLFGNGNNNTFKYNSNTMSLGNLSQDPDTGAVKYSIFEQKNEYRNDPVATISYKLKKRQ